jgi:hypothetical protein
MAMFTRPWRIVRSWLDSIAAGREARWVHPANETTRLVDSGLWLSLPEIEPSPQTAAFEPSTEFAGLIAEAQAADATPPEVTTGVIAAEALPSPTRTAAA